MPFIPDTPTRGGRFVPDDIGADFAKGEAHLRIPDAGPARPQADEPGTLESMLVGGPEMALSMASSIPAGVAGNVAGVVRSLTGGKFGTPEGAREGAETAGRVSRELTLDPVSKYGKNAMRTVGDIIEATKVQGLNPATPISAYMSGAGAAARRAGGAAARNVGGAVEEMAQSEGMRVPEPSTPAMAGVGSAETDLARMRRERAAGLPVPVKLTKGQADRTAFEQQQFERETAKGAAGGPLRERFAEQNENILRNFDTWVEQTGAQAPTLRATGQVVDEALVGRANKAKGRINDAYARARAAGELSEKVSTDSLVAFVEKNRSAARNAPVISAVEDELTRLGGATRSTDGRLVAGRMSINDLEEVRQMVGKLAEPGTPNGLFGKEAKAAIDGATEGAKGNLFKEARRLRAQYAREFEDRAIVAKLLDTKGKYADRAVAYEDVFKHSMLTSSLDDVRHLRKVLQGEGEKGAQAWRELQGQAVSYIREQAAGGVARDIKGNPQVSPAALDKAIRGLDADGKLDFIFGKQGAAQLRDLNDIAKDLTPVPGTVNTSNTSSALMRGLKEWGGAIASGKVGALIKVNSLIKKIREERAVNRRVAESLEEP